MDNLLDTLSEAGLGDKEARVYVSILELDIATVSKIAKNSGIKRSSVYVVLESLRRKGLVGISEDRKVRSYIASPPDALLKKASESVDHYVKIKSNIESIIPELNSLYAGIKHKPKVTVYEGKESLWQIYKDTLNSGAKELRVYEDVSYVLEVFPDFLVYDGKKRLENGIDLYYIAPAKKEIMKNCLCGIEINKEKMAFIPPEQFKFPVDITIYGDKVAFVSLKDMFGVIIEHRELAASLKSGFDLALAEAKRLNDKQKIKNITPTYYFKTPKDRSKLPQLFKLVEESFENPEKFLKKYSPAKEKR